MIVKDLEKLVFAGSASASGVILAFSLQIVLRIMVQIIVVGGLLGGAMACSSSGPGLYAPVEDHDDAVEAAPKNAALQYRRGRALLHWKRPKEAVEAFTKAMALKKNYLDAIYYRGLANRHIGAYKAALRDYEAVLAVRSKDASLYNNHADILLHMNRLDPALASANKAIALDESYIAAYVTRGEILEKQGFKEKACLNWSHACREGLSDICKWLQTKCTVKK